MASPHIAGVVALLSWAADPELIGDIDGTMALLSQTADPLYHRSCREQCSTEFPELHLRLWDGRRLRRGNHRPGWGTNHPVVDGNADGGILAPGQSMEVELS